MLNEEAYKDFLIEVNDNLSVLYSNMMQSLWMILTAPDERWISKFEQDEIAYQRYLSSKQLSKKALWPWPSKDLSLTELDHRQLVILQKEMLEFRTSSENIEKHSQLWNTLHSIISSYRSEILGRKYSEKEVLHQLRTSKNLAHREAVWTSYMKLGHLVQPGLLQLVEIRNTIAQENGFQNFYELKMYSQELSSSFMIELIRDLRRELDPLYQSVKSKIDQKLAQSYGINRRELRPWHYEHPFFQYVQEEEFEQRDIDIERLKNQLSEWFTKRNVNLDSILDQSDLSVREDKSQASFCLNLDRGKDIRLSCHLTSDTHSIKILLHELGHAFFENELEARLPFILRQPYIFLSEAIATLFERLPLTLSNEGNLKEYDERSGSYSPSLVNINNLIKLYWSITVVEFERKLYESPRENLNEIWWGLVEEIQGIQRPSYWSQLPCWAAKPHLTTLPVYYQNYLIGDILAAQIEKTLTSNFGSWYNEDAFEYLKKTIIHPGQSKSWSNILTTFNGSGFSCREYILQFSKTTSF